jgi:hypothetical protein
MSLKKTMTDRGGRGEKEITYKIRTLFSIVMSRFRGRRILSLYCILFNLLTCCYSTNMDMTIENKVVVWKKTIV